MGRRYTTEQFKEINRISEITEEEKSLIYEADDPVYWGEKYFSDPDSGEDRLRVKPLFYNILRDSRRDRAGRTGRQIGKTVHMVLDVLHTAAFNSNAIILIFVPEKKNMNRMLEIMGNFLKNSLLKNSFYMGKKSKNSKSSDIEPEYDYEIKSSSGSVIRFFFMSHKPDKARGQRGTHIYIDEVEYLPDAAFPVITGILKSNPKMSIFATSTPSGMEDTWFHNFCDKCANPDNNNGEEYHFPTTLEENWEEIRERLKEVIFDEVTWKLEVLAEWADAKGAVYKKEDIINAINRSIISKENEENGYYMTSEQIYQTLEYDRADKVIGIDWNTPQNGVRIVEIATLWNKPWVVRNEIISYENYTQINSVNRIIELHKKNKYVCISVDSGYGSTQIELLHKHLIGMNQNPENILNIVDATKKEEVIIEYVLPGSSRIRKRKIVIRVKNRIVDLLSQYLEKSLVLLQEEDEESNGLVKEIRKFKRKSANKLESGFQYTENTHSLSALQIGFHGYNKFILSKTKQTNGSSNTICTETINTIIRNPTTRNSTILSTPFANNKSNSRIRGLVSNGNKRRHIL